MSESPLFAFLAVGLPFLVPIGAVLLVAFVYRKEGAEAQKKRDKLEIKEADPYEDVPVIEGRMCIPKKLTPLKFKQIVWYILYFIFATIGVVAVFGKVEYGPNLPYTFFLAVTGIPFLVCFCHIQLKLEKQRYRLLASGVSQKDASSYVIRWIIITPIFLYVFIAFLLKIANYLFTI